MLPLYHSLLLSSPPYHSQFDSSKIEMSPNCNLNFFLNFHNQSVFIIQSIHLGSRCFTNQGFTNLNVIQHREFRAAVLQDAEVALRIDAFGRDLLILVPISVIEIIARVLLLLLLLTSLTHIWLIVLPRLVLLVSQTIVNFKLATSDLTKRERLLHFQETLDSWFAQLGALLITPDRTDISYQIFLALEWIEILVV